MKNFLPLIIAFSIFINPLNTLAEELTLAGGCFWCLEHGLESLEGINFVQSGYSGGSLENPTYDNHDGHQEVVLVNYCLLYTSPSPRDKRQSRMPSSA